MERRVYYPETLFYYLGYEHLQQNLLFQTEECVERMLPSIARDSLALDLLKKYLGAGDFEHALALFRYFEKDNMATEKALSLFIWKAQRANNIEMAMKALHENKSKCVETWRACVKDLSQCLLENNEVETSKELQLLYPEAFEKDNEYCEAVHYSRTDRFQEAVSIIVYSSSFSEQNKIKILRKILANCKYQ